MKNVPAAVGARILFLFAATAIAGTSVAQKVNPIGVAPRNADGNIFSAYWTDREFIPERLNGGLHIRVGLSGRGTHAASGGNPSCDPLLIWVARSGKPLAKDELEACALSEFEFKKGAVGDSRNIADQFVRADVIKEFTPVVEARLQTLKTNNVFYFRSGSLEISPYDMATKTFTVRANVTLFNVRSKYVHNLSFAGPGTVVGGVFTQRATVDGELAREIEAARAAGRIERGSNEIQFRVKGVSQNPADNVRFIIADKLDWAVQITDSQGRTRRIGYIPLVK